MLFAGWEGRIEKKKTVTEVLKMLTEAAGRGQHFQDRGLALKWLPNQKSRQLFCFVLHVCLFFSEKTS